MSDSLGDGYGNPTKLQMNLYKKWALGGVAASIIGEVQCHPKFAEKPGNLVLNDQSDHAAFKQLAENGTQEEALLWLQLGHAGALTHPPIGIPKGPSKLEYPELSCEALTLDEIKAIPTNFANSARLGQKLGFHGVQIHAAHGFLLSQFLSPLFNKRSDHYGGTIMNRMRLLMETIEEVNLAINQQFAITLKINSSDQIEGGLVEEDSLKVINALDHKKIDLIDISGGTYFPGAKSSSERASKGAYFTDYAQLARTRTSIPLMATGGFKAKDQAAKAISDKIIDCVGLARALILDPFLPSTWHKSSKNPEFPNFKSLPSGGLTAWYSMQLTNIASGNAIDMGLDIEEAISHYEKRDKNRTTLWNSKFNHIEIV